MSCIFLLEMLVHRELCFLLLNPLPCLCFHWQWTKYAFIQCEWEVSVHVCRKGAALCWECWMPMHRTLNVAHVSSATCPWGSLQTLIVTVIAVHSLRLNSEVYPVSDRCTRTFGSSCITDMQLTGFTSALVVRLRGVLACTYCDLS